MIWVATGAPILTSDLVAQVDSTGNGSIRLPYTDQPGFADGAGHSVTNWTYRATFSLDGVDSPDVVNFQLPLGPAAIDLDLATPVGSSVGALVDLPSVISVNGQTGVVVIEAGGGAVSSVAGKTGAVTLTRSDVGLGSVDNTADLAKPMSTATKTYVDAAVAGAGGGSGLLSMQTVTTDTTLTTSSANFVKYRATAGGTITLPNDAPAGMGIEVYQADAGAAILAAPPGVALRIAPPGTGFKTPGKYGSVFALCHGGITAVPPTTDMLYRLQGDTLSGSTGAAVTSWADSSGLSLPAATQSVSGNQPTLNTNSGGTGHKGVAFNGSSQFLNLSGSALDLARNRGALTVFVAVVFPSAITNGTRTIFALSTGTSNSSSRVLLGHRDSVSGAPIAGGRRADSNSLASTTGTPIATVQNTILTARYDWTNSDVYLHQNGVLTGSNTSFQTNGSTDNTASQAGVIGANLTGTGEWFQGHILEIIVYASADSSGAIRQAVHSYFKQTYGISSNDAVDGSEWVVSGGVA